VIILQNIKELYIFGQPLNTRIGQINFIKLADYPLLMQFVYYLDVQKFEIINFLQEKKLPIARFVYLNNLSFLNLIKELKNDIELYQVYKALFILCFKEDVFDFIENDEEFDYYRDLIKEMNVIQTIKKNPNPEIERFNTYERIYNRSKGLDITLESIITSVWVLGINPFELTIYSLYALFNRISNFKKYDASVIHSILGGKMHMWFTPMGSEEKEEETLDGFENDLRGMDLNIDNEKNVKNI
jgi:hypothetical protein